MNCGVPVEYIVDRLAATSRLPATSSLSRTDRLNRAEELAAPTRRRVNELHNVIDDHRRMDSTRRMFDQFNDLEGVAHHAGRLCHALDQWKHWANGRNLDNPHWSRSPPRSRTRRPTGHQPARRTAHPMGTAARTRTPTADAVDTDPVVDGHRNRLLRGRQLAHANQ